MTCTMDEKKEKEERFVDSLTIIFVQMKKK